MKIIILLLLFLHNNCFCQEPTLSLTESIDKFRGPKSEYSIWLKDTFYATESVKPLLTVNKGQDNRFYKKSIYTYTAKLKNQKDSPWFQICIYTDTTDEKSGKITDNAHFEIRECRE